MVSGSAGAIISRVMEKFNVTAMELAQFTRSTALEFYEVYRGIVSDFLAMTFELASGDFIALEIGDKHNPFVNPVKKFRDLCGPADSCIARSLWPHSIRSEFGVNKVKNAIHCTDLEEDDELESQYIFMHEWTFDGQLQKGIRVLLLVSGIRTDRSKENAIIFEATEAGPKFFKILILMVFDNVLSK